MIRVFRIMCILLCITMYLLFVGCSKTNSSSKNEINSNTQSSKPQTVTLKVMLNAPPELDLSPNNIIIKRAEEITKIKLEIEAPPQANYFERLKTVMSSGEYPDFFEMGSDANFENWAVQGILADLTYKYKSYPNLAAIPNTLWEDCRVRETNKIQAVVRPNYDFRQGFIINKQWLDNLGLKPPQTIEEFKDICYAFTFNDPDKNGKSDTVGFVPLNGKPWSWPNDFILTAFNMSRSDGMPDIDGKYHIKQKSSHYYDVMNLFRDMYEKGTLDKECFTFKAEESFERLAKKKAGITGIGEDFIWFIDKFNLNYDDFKYCPPLKSNYTDERYYAYQPGTWWLWAVTNNEKVDDVLRFLDFTHSPEGFKLFSLGIKGIHYNSYDIKERKVDRTPKQESSLLNLISTSMQFSPGFEGKPSILGGSKLLTYNKWKTDTQIADKVTTDIKIPFCKELWVMTDLYPDQCKMVETLELRYITGEIKMEDLKDYIDTVFYPTVKHLEENYNRYLQDNPPVFVKPSQK